MADILEKREEIARFGLRWRILFENTWHREKYTDTVQSFAEFYHSTTHSLRS